MHAEFFADNGCIGEFSGFAGKAQGGFLGKQLIFVRCYFYIAFGFDGLKFHIVNYPVGTYGDGGAILGGDLFNDFIGPFLRLFHLLFKQFGPGTSFQFSRRRRRKWFLFFQNNIALGDNAVRILITHQFIGRNVPFIGRYFFRMDIIGSNIYLKAAQHGKSKTQTDHSKRAKGHCTLLGRDCCRGCYEVFVFCGKEYHGSFVAVKAYARVQRRINARNVRFSADTVKFKVVWLRWREINIFLI